MEQKVYDRMDWARIEALVYSEEDHPSDILGPHITEDGILIEAFRPDAETMYVKIIDSGKKVKMIREDEEGYFAVLIPGDKVPDYRLVAAGEGKEETEYADPYFYPGFITEKDERRFAAGRLFDLWDKLGAHPLTIGGVSGTAFAVWAPNALRVSVVGDFNGWDGRALPMNRSASGIFELFVPGVGEGQLYKYELKLKDGLCYLKSDPVAFFAECNDNHASIVQNMDGFAWNDKNWMESRKAKQSDEAPIFIYEMNPEAWSRKMLGRDFSYRETAEEVRDYVLKEGFTHIELTPLMEYPDDVSRGFETSGYFAPTGRYGSPADFMYFVDVCHKAGIGVILDWVPGFFARGNDGLSSFDGTCLYEHLDPRKGVHPFWNTFLLNNGRPEVSGFLISAALFWLKYYHIDGLRTVELASMLYLDYGRRDGEWIANIYGGNENLEAVDFVRRMNNELKAQYPDVILAAEDTSGWPEITGNTEDGGLGYDYVWNFGWQKDYLDYIQLDPFFRGAHQDDLTLSFVYAYSERFILPLSDNPSGRLETAMPDRMPGAKIRNKLANLRLSMAYMTVHPGKKMLFAGIENGIMHRSVFEESGRLIADENQKKMEAFTADLTKLYRSQPALYKKDTDSDTVEWISNLDARRNLLIFQRKSDQKEQNLLVVCNFSNVEYDGFRVGVSLPGKYKEIFNSDAEAYGGNGAVNPRVKMTSKIECDEREYSVKLKIAPLAVEVYRYSSEVQPVHGNASARKEKESAPAAKAKKTGSRKTNAANSASLKAKLEESFYQEEKAGVKAEQPGRKRKKG
ncbi:MAG: 1,4-alpha-glucan branching protein GlgB [Eubacterium sp.]|nr:1,4-alpha-glucan branching protein GlgB [Eubacterium sp.]